LNDTGLAAYLQNIGEEHLAGNRELLGGLLETFVCNELLKQSSWSSVQPQFFHYRTHSGLELDLFLESRSGMRIGIEVKAASSPSGHDLRAIKQILSSSPKQIDRGIVFYTGDRALTLGENLYALPVSTLWSNQKMNAVG
jgi:uncharacterized protein